MFAFTLLFAACIGLIRTQSYDDSELRAFLTPPDGCPMPCFMGIRPGVTTVPQAQTILRAHPWVEAIDFYQNEILIVPWTGLQPRVVDPSIAGHVTYSRERGDIYQIWIPTAVATGELFLLIGEPTHVAFFPRDLSNPSSRVVVQYEYFDRFLVLLSEMPCPINLADFWKSRVTVYIISEGFRDIESGFIPWHRKWFEGETAWC